MILDSIDMTVDMMAHALTAPGGNLRPWALGLGYCQCRLVDDVTSTHCHQDCVISWCIQIENWNNAIGLPIAVWGGSLNFESSSKFVFLIPWKWTKWNQTPIEHIFVPACSSARKIHFFPKNMSLYALQAHPDQQNMSLYPLQVHAQSLDGQSVEAHKAIWLWRCI